MSIIRSSNDNELSVNHIMALVVVLGEAVREATETSPLRGVPAGHLYALSAQPAGLTLDTFERCIDLLVRAGLVSRKNHLLAWVGPKLTQK